LALLEIMDDFGYARLNVELSTCKFCS